MFDRIREEEHQQKLEKFLQRSDNAKLSSVLSAIEKLSVLMSTEPSLTRHQWALLDDTVAELNDLVK